MHRRFFVEALLIGLLLTVADASDGPTFPFVDGLWKGAIGVGADSDGQNECWASTTDNDSTSFTLAKRGGGIWYLRLTNPSWRLPPFHQYAVVTLVDFYPKLDIVAESKSKTVLEISHLEKILLLRLLENGHTITLSSDGFNAKYVLEGTAKIIERLRNCAID